MAFKIYTKTGDKGKTSLIGGTKVPKNHLRIESYGTIDELNSFIGLLNDQLAGFPEVSIPVVGGSAVGASNAGVSGAGAGAGGSGVSVPNVGASGADGPGDGISNVGVSNAGTSGAGVSGAGTSGATASGSGAGVSSVGVSSVGTSGAGVSGASASGSGASGAGVSSVGVSNAGTSGAGVSGSGTSGASASGDGISNVGAFGGGASNAGVSSAGAGAFGSDPLREIQDRLFTIGSSLACDPDKESKMKIPDLKMDDITWLENAIDQMDAELPPMKSFILPGGHVAVSTAHIVRCVCRRAERVCVRMQEEGLFIEPLVLQYINRLSDYFFTLARFIAHRLGAVEIPWKPRLEPGPAKAGAS